MDTFQWTVASLVLAFVLWILVFLIRPFEFWLMMSASTSILLLVAAAINSEKISKRVNYRTIILGVVTGLLLYVFFFVGYQFTKSLNVFSQGVTSVYDLRSGVPVAVIALLLLFPIAPSEEVYWRGLVQRRLMEKFGGNNGLAIAAGTYALVHLPTLNPPLILTALIGGIVWGWIYKSSKQLEPVILSHVIFDVMIFVIAPLS